MIKVSHRVNTLEQLKKTPKDQGVEVDIRSFGEELIIHHDPFKKGENFEVWLETYDHSLLILNVKEEGIEVRLREIMNKKNIENYFILDISQPFSIKYFKQGLSDFSIRLSHFEILDSLKRYSDFKGWIWLDSLNGPVLNEEIADYLRNSSLKTCLVSPELVGDGIEEIKEYKKLHSQLNYIPDAVCTKRPELW